MCWMFSSHLLWTSGSFDVPAGVIQEEGQTGLIIHLPSAVRALIFLARRIQPFLPFVYCQVELCVLTISSFSTCFFLVKIFSRLPGFELTSQRVRRLRGYFWATGATVQYEEVFSSCSFKCKEILRQTRFGRWWKKCRKSRGWKSGDIVTKKEKRGGEPGGVLFSYENDSKWPLPHINSPFF